MTPGWNDIARVHDSSIPPERQKSETAAYCGVLYGLAVALKPKVIVEIGCQFGLSTRMFLATGAEVHSYDVDLQCGDLHLSLPVEWQKNWHFHPGKSQEIEPRGCDLLYVDGDHSYEAVVSDMARHAPLVRDGGLVVLDDYHEGWPGKMRWVDERWNKIDPLLIGPTAVVRVTPETWRWFTEKFA